MLEHSDVVGGVGGSSPSTPTKASKCGSLILFLNSCASVMIFYVYILQSNRNRHYIGFTSDLESRVYKHNKKHTGFAGTSEEWKVLKFVTLSDKFEALRLEKYLKSLKNWKKALEYLDKIKHFG